MKKILCLLFFCFVISITSNSSAKTFYTGDQVKDLSKLPSREELIAKTVGLIKSPLNGLVGTLSNPLRGFINVLNNVKNNK